MVEPARKGDAVVTQGHESAQVAHARQDTVPLSPSPSPQGVIEAARALVNKLHEAHAHPRYAMVWQMAQLHIGPYDGPTYTRELEALEAALVSPGAAHQEQERKATRGVGQPDSNVTLPQGESGS